MMRSIITTQWYRECLDQRSLLFYSIWREALRQFAPHTPILLVHNGGPSNPPYTDVEVVRGVNLVEHERGGFGHSYNCWRSMCYGWEIAQSRGYDCAIYISQNLIVGAPFVEQCAVALRDADVLYNRGSLGHNLAFTEYMAVNPQRTGRLTEMKYQREMILLEGMVPAWCFELKLREGGFPVLWRRRDAEYRSSDTCLYFSSRPELAAEVTGCRHQAPTPQIPYLPLSDALRFAAEHGIRTSGKTPEDSLSR